MQIAPPSHTSSPETSSSPSSSGSEHSHVNLHALEYQNDTSFVLTVKDKEVLKNKYLKDFETGDRDLCKQVIGNAVRELAMLCPQGSQPSKKKVTKVCVMYSHMWV